MLCGRRFFVGDKAIVLETKQNIESPDTAWFFNNYGVTNELRVKIIDENSKKSVELDILQWLEAK